MIIDLIARFEKVVFVKTPQTLQTHCLYGGLRLRVLLHLFLLCQIFLHLNSPVVDLSSCHDRILHWIVFTDTRGNRLELHASIESPKEGYRVSLSAAFVDDSVYCRNEIVISLAHKTVGNVDDKRSRDWLGFNPVPSFAEDFKTAAFILGDDGETFKVGMGADSILVVDGMFLFWVVQDPHAGFGFPDVLVESVFWEVKGKSKYSGHASG